MKVIYSCVVDGDPRFAIQAANLVLSLKAVGVAPGRITVNLTPAASIYRGRFEKMGVSAKDVPFFADRKYCNKVVQLRNASAQADYVVCCDTDIFFLENIERALPAKPTKVLGKMVDFANPPIERLLAILQQYPEIPQPAEAFSDIDIKPTFAGNFNGGLYIIPGHIVPSFSAKWEALALSMYHNESVKDALGEYVNHLDQISFCLALSALKIPCKTLPIAYNYPIHRRMSEEIVESVGDAQVIHYHDAIDENHLPNPKNVENGELRRKITAAVEHIRTLWYLEAMRDGRQKEASRHFTFVMGFHRSGTSLLTAGCEHVGISTGIGSLDPATPDNPKGYFENGSLVRLNEEILKDLESDWDDIFFSYDGRQEAMTDQYLARIVEMLEKEFPVRTNERYVLKDPRLMRTYPIWRSVVQAMGCGKPDIIFVCRNPLECAFSERKRHHDQFERNGNANHFFGRNVLETLLLWYSYNLGFLRSLQDERILFVRYEDVMAKPQSEMERISTWAATEHNADSIDRFASAFLEKGLRHHESSVVALREATERFPEIPDLFERLESLCRKESVSRTDIEMVVDAHKESYADLMNLSFLGRLYSVAKRSWVHERGMRFAQQ